MERKRLDESKTLTKDRHELIRKVNPNSVVRQIDVIDLKKALRSRLSGGDDEQGSGGLWDLAFEETLSYLFYELGLTDLTDKEHHEYTLLAEEVYNILVLNHYVFNDEENDINIGTVVKILQKNAPYNSYGKIGTVVDIDYEEAEMWYQVQFDKPNPETPYETWVREQDLQVLNENTLNKNKTLTEAEETGFTIEYPNGDFYIGKPIDLYFLMTDFLINWDYDKTTMTEYEAENVASIRENYEEVFYAALEGGNYWEGQEFEEAFGRFSDYGIANTLLSESTLKENKRLNENHILTPEEYVNYDILIEEQPDFRFTNAFVEGEYLVLERWDKNRLTHSAVLEVFDTGFDSVGWWLTEKDFYYLKAGERGLFDDYYYESAEFFDTYEEYIESEIEQLLLYQEDSLENVGLEVLLYI